MARARRGTISGAARRAAQGALLGSALILPVLAADPPAAGAALGARPACASILDALARGDRARVTTLLAAGREMSPSLRQLIARTLDTIQRSYGLQAPARRVPLPHLVLENGVRLVTERWERAGRAPYFVGCAAFWQEGASFSVQVRDDPEGVEDGLEADVLR